jgi:hypothetical protein
MGSFLAETSQIGVSAIFLKFFSVGIISGHAKRAFE